ncbi:MAG: hydantoinase/oxoprolinase family protein [Chloroflexi bacterium]|nr:hydantoinase/oxoprolinase family protein [Chloroflexota bacterium]
MKQDEYVIGIDTGGTFTDVVAVDRSGRVWIDKAPTTPGDFSRGVIDAITKLAEDIGLPLQQLLDGCWMVKHGTTVATNALINRHGSKVGLITTRGFEDTTLIMRAIGRVAGLGEEELRHQATAVKPEPIVPRELIRGVSELVDSRGNVVIPINVGEAREAIRSLIEDQGVETIACNFLFSFVNPSHEETIERLVRETYPGTPVSVHCSHRLIPVVREYARSNTVIINAFLAKTVHNYIHSLGLKLKHAGYRHPLLIMQANGGMGYEEGLAPISTLESGPCGGMIASKFMADTLGHSAVITTDMGGTSFDVGVILNGAWQYARETVVERFHITWPMMDIQSIGAGGGTISRVDPATGRLLVGPKSSGADPGPVCYGRGNLDPAVSDADLVLRFLNEGYFLGGRIKLDKQKAEKSIAEKIARPLGIDTVKAAAGIYDIINASMADLIRKQVIQKGMLPPEDYVAYAFGGAGPVHAAAWASELGIKRVYVFPTSAVFSAFGVSAADIVHTHVRSHRSPMPTDPGGLNELLSGIEEELARSLRREGLADRDIEFRRTFYLRYRRQLNELPIGVPSKVYDANDMNNIVNTFEKRYEEVYGPGSAYSVAGVELISIGIDAVGKVRKPVLTSHGLAGADASKALKGTRRVFFPGGINKSIQTKIYDYTKIEPGNRVEGPCIVETPFTTVVIPPKTSCSMDAYRNLEIVL